LIFWRQSIFFKAKWETKLKVLLLVRELIQYYKLCLSKASIKIDTLTNLLQENEFLNLEQWQEACKLFDHITTKVTETIHNTSMAPPIPQLTNNTNRLGGFLPRKLQQKWEKLIAMHHLIRKTIYIVKTEPKGRNHPIL
jgi:hypothetical protein